MNIPRLSILKLIALSHFLLSPSGGADFTSESALGILFSFDSRDNKTTLATPILTKPTANLNSTELKVVETPTPPKYLPLSEREEQFQTLVRKAKIGEKIALKTLLKRIFWHATRNPFTLEDVLKFPDCQKKAFSEKGYLYWNLIDLCDGFHKFPGLEEKIKDLATQHNSVTAQYMWGLLIDKSWRLGGAKESAKWYQKAVDQKYSPAQLKLALLHENGEGGLDQSREKKIEFSKLACQQGYLPAMYFHACHLDEYGDYNGLYRLNLLFYSSWAIIPGQYNKIDSLYWALNDKIAKYFYLNYRSLFAFPTPKPHFPESYFTKIEQIGKEALKNLEILTQMYSIQVPEEIKNTYPQIREFLNLIPKIMSCLRDIDPGFKITCTLPTPVDAKNLYPRNPKLPYFFKEGELIHPNGEKILYQNIGFRNNDSDTKIERWEGKCQEVLKAYDTIIEKNIKNRNQYEKKVKKYLGKKETLEGMKESNEISSAEADLIPNYLTHLSLKTHLHEKMMVKMMIPIPDLYTALCQGMREIISTYHNFILEGIPHRNNEFIAYYNLVIR